MTPTHRRRGEKFFAPTVNIPHQTTTNSRLFRLIVGYRWLALLPPLILLLTTALTGGSVRQQVWVWLLAVVSNSVLGMMTRRFNEWLQKQPALLLADLVFVAGLVFFSDGWQSPYFLYALSPIMAAAFFFQIRGALITASALLPLYIIAIITQPNDSAQPINWIVAGTEMAGFFLLGGAFGYAAYLLARWRKTHGELLAAQAQLAVQTEIDMEMARQRATSRERMRIARDMHDTISQSLFGVAYGLDGCVRLLPAYPDDVKAELELLVTETQTLRTDVRDIIFDLWPDELSAERFSADLQQFTEGLGVQTPALDFDIRGEFGALSPQARRGLYRICQESLANICRHSAADNARVCLDIDAGRARLLVRDDGAGFNLGRAYGEKSGELHYGLSNMADRARGLGGTFDIYSRPSQGTSIVVDIPTEQA